MEYDIRESGDHKITHIRFGDCMSDVVRLHSTGVVIEIAPGDEGEVFIYDVDNLIRALEKAKELWG